MSQNTMAFQPTFLLRLVFLLSVAAALVSPMASVQVDSNTPTDDVNIILIDGAARFAVEAHNKQKGTTLVYIHVVRFEVVQTVSGINYKIVVEAADTGVKKVYAAVVHVGKELSRLTLVSFQLVVKN
ncbi:hypothetical protein Taro_051417 [Colocasia esculenta]|uniref:Cystatin domain-containing protein n=1 Tax=Colocasia esculenta TaxID=4460 RepID=A0A843XH43_COLES|nr:hypothetical protein [Colocasia esculenta]